jgi:hypothetical protein
MSVVAEKEITNNQIFKTTNLYQMAYLKYKGAKHTKTVKNSVTGKTEVWFEGPNIFEVAALYRNSSERELLDSYIVMKSIVYGDAEK